MNSPGMDVGHEVVSPGAELEGDGRAGVGRSDGDLLVEVESDDSLVGYMSKRSGCERTARCRVGWIPKRNREAVSKKDLPAQRRGTRRTRLDVLKQVGTSFDTLRIGRLSSSSTTVAVELHGQTGSRRLISLLAAQKNRRP
jgi:hypothetical protein